MHALHSFKWHFRCSARWIQIWVWNAYTSSKWQQWRVDWRNGALSLLIYRSDGLVYLWIESFIQHHQMVIGWNQLESFWSGNQDVWYSGASALFLEGTRDLVRWNSLTSVQPLVLGHALTAFCCVFHTNTNMTFSWYFNMVSVKWQKTSFVPMYNWHQWFHEEPSTSVEPFHSTKGFIEPSKCSSHTKRFFMNSSVKGSLENQEWSLNGITAKTLL